MPMPLGRIIRCQLGGNLGSGELWRTHLDLLASDTTGSVTMQEVEDIADAVGAAFIANFLSLSVSSTRVRDIWSNATTFNVVEARCYLDGVLEQTVSVPQTNTVGTGDRGVPANNAICVTLLTNLSTRSGRGRVYLPWTSNGNAGQEVNTVSGGQMTTDMVQTLAGGYADFYTAVNALDVTIAGNAGQSVNPSVLSLTTSSIRVVRSVRVDSIGDTQHGRTRQLTPSAVEVVAVVL